MVCRQCTQFHLKGHVIDPKTSASALAKLSHKNSPRDPKLCSEWGKRGIAARKKYQEEKAYRDAQLIAEFIKKPSPL